MSGPPLLGPDEWREMHGIGSLGYDDAFLRPTGENQSFEISEYRCGAFGALIALSFAVAFAATVVTLVVVL